MDVEATWLEVAALVVLIAASAFFSGSETALVSLSRHRVRGMLDRNVHGAQAVSRLLEDRNRFLTTVLIGNTVALLAADSLATALLIRARVPNAVLWSTLVMAVLVLLFGEILPKTVTVSSPDVWAAKLAPILERVAVVLMPINRLMLGTTNLIVRLFGVTPTAGGPFVTEEDIRSLVDVGAEQKVLEEQEREMIHSVIEFGDTIVREVMTPRPDMIALDVADSPRHALDVVIAEGYSKLPVYDQTIDNVVGVVHDRELLVSLANGSLSTVGLSSLMRPVTHVPESKKIADLLREMQRGKFTLAIVVDEYGGTAGLVTMEDLLEEIVGEIRDEHDDGEEEPIRMISRDESVVDAGTNIEDVNARLGIRLPHEEFETIGGFTVGLFGRLPQEGEEIDASDSVRLRVNRTRGRRILAVRITTNGAAEGQSDTAHNGHDGHEQPSSAEAAS